MDDSPPIKMMRFGFMLIFLSIFFGCSHDHPQPKLDNPMDMQKSTLNHDDSKQTTQQNDIPPNKKLKKTKVKGIYVSGPVAGSDRMDELIQLIKNSSLNAMVIDVKTDSGIVTYASKLPEVNQFQSNQKAMISNMPELMNRLKQNNIYTIARIVTFKDPNLAEKKPEWAMQRKSGGVWKDQKGIAWVDPYLEEIQNYNLQIAKEAVDLGFDEIQFDYVRFPDNGIKTDEEVDFHNPKQRTKAEVIADFLSKARKQINAKGAFVSADVFGLTTTTQDDMGIGQDWNLISLAVDYISPMVYPSHYSNGMYGIQHPDLEPFRLISQALQDGNEKNEQLKSNHKAPATIRPWLQAFTAKWKHPHQHYDLTQIKQQIKAASEQGVDEYLLWNPLSQYTI